MFEPLVLFQVLCWVQGIYYLVTGAWPLVSVRTFQAVTGRKTDNWTGREADHFLLFTVGVLIVAVSLAILVAAVRAQPNPETVVLACASIVALTGIDVVFVARKVIPPIYLLDAVAEVILFAGWVTFLLRW